MRGRLSSTSDVELPDESGCESPQYFTSMVGSSAGSEDASPATADSPLFFEEMVGFSPHSTPSQPLASSSTAHYQVANVSGTTAFASNDQNDTIEPLTFDEMIEPTTIFKQQLPNKSVTEVPSPAVIDAVKSIGYLPPDDDFTMGSPLTFDEMMSPALQPLDGDAPDSALAVQFSEMAGWSEGSEDYAVGNSDSPQQPSPSQRRAVLCKDLPKVLSQSVNSKLSDGTSTTSVPESM